MHTGILRTMQNMDQLGIVLSHEMAHAVLGHGVRFYRLLAPFYRFFKIFNSTGRAIFLDQTNRLAGHRVSGSDLGPHFQRWHSGCLENLRKY